MDCGIRFSVRPLKDRHYGGNTGERKKSANLDEKCGETLSNEVENNLNNQTQLWHCKICQTFSFRKARR